MLKLKFTICLLFFATCYLHSQVNEIWGVTRKGGLNDAGVVYKLDENGNNFQVVKEFPKNQGLGLNGTVEGYNGMLYGFCNSGGLNNGGTFFEYDPVADTQRTLMIFNTLTTGALTNLIQIPIETDSGVFIGYTTKGIIEFDVNTMTLSTKISSSSYFGRIWNMMRASNGKIYGTKTKSQSSNSGDEIFEYNPQTNTMITKYSFPSSRVNGFDAIYRMIELNNGVLYGVTRSGQTTGGVIFSYNYLTNSFSKRKELNDWIRTQLTPHSNGKLYFSTFTGGAFNNGRFYEYTPSSNSLTSKFDIETGSSNPIEISSTKFLFAKYSSATVPAYFYEYTISNNTINVLDTIDADLQWRDVNSLMKHSNGRVYGTSTVSILDFDIIQSKASTVAEFYNFFDGANPNGRLLQASDGSIYGTTSSFVRRQSKLFKINPNTLDYEVIHHFKEYINDFNSPYRLLVPEPNGYLLEVNNRYLYGTASVTGASEDDILFRFDIQNDTMEYLAKFYSGTTGNNPNRSLSLTSNNTILGTCREGGINNGGTIFEYDISADTLVKKIDLNSAAVNPSSGLVLLSNGEYWGISESGGLYNDGGVFEYNYFLNAVS
ncbi:MAG: hypothetical protein DWP98_10450, partial [Bacteroidetes bacterium]